MGRYEVCTAGEPLAADQGEALEALDAFGAAGEYKRSTLARLYGGARVRVVRQWTTSGRRFVSVTRLSPYPDASLRRLWPGTMEIRFTIERAEHGTVQNQADSGPIVVGRRQPARTIIQTSQ